MEEFTAIENEGSLNENGEKNTLYDKAAYNEQERMQLIRQSYIDIINIVSDAIYVLDQTFTFIEINKGAEIMYQYSREELIGLNPTTVAAPGLNDMELIQSRLQSVLETGEPERFDFWARRKNGEIFPKDVIVNRGKFFDQNVLIATARDMSDKIKSENVLKDYENRYETLLKKSGIGVGNYSIDGKILYFNEKAIQHLGGKLEDYIGKSVLDVFGKDTGSEYMRRFQLVATSEKSLEFEDFVSFANRDYWFLSNHTKIIDNQGELVGIEVIAHDITDRKLAEKEIEQSQLEFKDLFENAPIGYHEIDLEGRIVRMNQTELDMLGYTIDEVTGKYIWEIISDSDFSKEQTKCKLTVKQNSIIPYERKFIHKKGSKIPVLLKDKQLLSQSDEIIGNRSSVQDISELKQAEKVLKLRETYLTAIIENLPGIIWLKDSESHIQLANTKFAHTFGREKPEDLIGKTDLDFSPKEHAEKYLADDKKVVSSKKPLHVEELIYDQDSVKWFETFKMPIFDENREVIGTAGYAQDVSERKETQLEVEKISKHYQTIIEKSPDGFVLLNSKGLFEYASPSALRMFGFELAELTSTPPNDLTHPDDLAMVLSHLNKLVEDPTYVPIIEYRFKHKNGDWSWIESTFSNLLADPNVESILINFRNINERKISESILKQERELYLDLVNTQPAGIYRIRVSSVEKWTENAWSNSSNSPYIVELASDRFCEILGVSRTEFENNPKIIGDLVHPDDLAEYEIKNKEANFNQTPFSWDCRLLIKGVVRWVHFESIPRRLENGDLIFTGILYDIKDRKLAEEELLGNKNLLKDLLNKTTEFIESGTEDIDFEQLCKQIKEISGAKYSSFNLYETNGLDFKTVAMVGFKDVYSRAIQLLGFDVKNKLWKFDPIRDEKIKDRTITRFENMVELNGKVIPKQMSKLLQSTFNLGEIQIVNISKKNKRVGDFTLYFEKNTRLKNDEIVELFAGQVALFVDRKMAEKKRDENKLRLKRAELASKSGNWELHLDTNTIISSEGANILYGLYNDQFNYNVVKDIPLPEYRPIMDQALKNLIQKNESYNIEFQIQTADKHEIKDIHSTALYDKDRNVVFGVIQDITDRKAAERKLQDNRDILRKLLFSSSGFIDSSSELIDYKKISDTIQEISGARYCSFNMLNQKKSGFRTVAISGIDTIQKTIKSIIGFDLMNREWEYDSNKEKKINNQIVTKFDSLSELTGTVLPKKIVTTTSTMFNLGEVWVVQIRKSNLVIGDFTLLFPKNETLQNLEIVELYANQIALYIERKHIEIELFESENKYRILFAENPQPILVYDLETLAILEVNQTAVNFYGYSKDEFLSMTLTELHPKSEISEFLNSIEETRVGKKTDGVSLHQKRNGENVYVQISSTQAPIYGPHARHILIDDITQRLMAEQKLAESERFFRKSQQAAKIGSYNLNFATGMWTSSEVLDNIFGINENYDRSVQGWLRLVYEEDREMMNDYFANQVVALRQRFNKEYRVSRKSDGKVFWVLGLGELTIVNDVIISMIGTIQDITERKLIEEELQGKMSELIRFQKVTVGRELMMIDLKKEINELLVKLGQEPKYKIVG